MNIMALLFLFGAVGVSFAGIYVYLESAKRSLHRVFGALCLVSAFVSFDQFMMMQSSDPARAFIWLKGLSVGQFLIPMLAHFAILYTGRLKVFHSTWIWVLLYMPSLVILALSLFTEVSFHTMKATEWGFVPVNSMATLKPILPWFLALMVMTIALMVAHYLHLQDQKEKRQAKFVVLGMISPFLLLSIPGLISRLTNIGLPDLTNLAGIFMAGFMGFAIWRCDPFSQTPITVTHHTVATMPDLLIFTRPDGGIASTNPSEMKVLGYQKEDLIQRAVTDFISGEIIEAFFDGTRNPDTVHTQGISNLETSLTAKDGTEIPASVAVPALKERDSDPAGFVLIARDSRARLETEQALRRRDGRGSMALA